MKMIYQKVIGQVEDNLVICYKTLQLKVFDVLPEAFYACYEENSYERSSKKDG